MMSGSWFVRHQNIDLFIDRLGTETDPAVRDAIRRLLVEEEGRVEQLSERLELLEHHIEQASRRITSQKRHVEALELDGRDAGPARRSLANFEEIHQLLMSHRQSTIDAINRGQA